MMTLIDMETGEILIQTGTSRAVARPTGWQAVPPSGEVAPGLQEVGVRRVTARPMPPDLAVLDPEQFLARLGGPLAVSLAWLGADQAD